VEASAQPDAVHVIGDSDFNASYYYGQVLRGELIARHWIHNQPHNCCFVQFIKYPFVYSAYDFEIWHNNLHIICLYFNELSFHWYLLKHRRALRDLKIWKKEIQRHRKSDRLHVTRIGYWITFSMR
jgi:hypothetical protein